MSESVGATNQPGSITQNASAVDGRMPGSSARMYDPSAHIAQMDDNDYVCIFISKVRTDSTITHRIGLTDGADWRTDLGECEDASGEYCHISLLISLLT